MGHHESHESKIKKVYWGMILLAIVTLVEVAVSLLGKGHLGIDLSGSSIILVIIGIALIALSLYKAYYIIYEFMHMGHEVKSLRMTVLLPTLLLVWAIIAFFQEGNSWKDRRNVIEKRNNINPDDVKAGKTGMLYEHSDWKDDGIDS